MVKFLNIFAAVVVVYELMLLKEGSVSAAQFSLLICQYFQGKTNWSG